MGGEILGTSPRMTGLVAFDDAANGAVDGAE